jgi:tRNA dimethylallyltransferase
MIAPHTPTTSSQPLITVVGPTASGKTKLAVELAHRFQGEVISADSRQVYRSLDIGTAKVTPEETEGVPHHLIDIVSLPEIYTVADFVRDASNAIADIYTRKRLPIVAGGTLFYVDALLGKCTWSAVPPNPALRKRLATQPTTELYATLQRVDPNRAKTIDQHNPRRVIRAIEIATHLSTQTPAVPQPQYNACQLAITRDRDDLRERLAQRARKWLNAGIVAETEALLTQGITRNRIRELGFEYQLTLNLIDGELTRSHWCERFVQKNWQYAKRQLTWLRRDTQVHWIRPEDIPHATEVVRSVLGCA